MLSKQQEMNEIRDLLKQKNIKVTLPRLTLYWILKQQAQELTAYEIEELSIAIDQRINLATIYSTLRLYMQMGIVQRYKNNTEQAIYMLTDIPKSIQMICLTCKHIEFLNDGFLQQHLERMCKERDIIFGEYFLTINIKCCLYCRKKN